MTDRPAPLSAVEMAAIGGDPDKYTSVSMTLRLLATIDAAHDAGLYAASRRMLRAFWQVSVDNNAPWTEAYDAADALLDALTVLDKSADPR